MLPSRPLLTRLPARRLVAAAGLAAAAALGAVACVKGPAASGDVVAGPASSDAIEVVAVDNAFEPAQLSAPTGTDVTVEVRNAGDKAHNFVVDDLDVSTGTLDPGEVVTATFEVPDGGVEFVCTFHGGMRGRLDPA